MMQIDELETMGRAALLAAWSDTFGMPAPKGISRTFLRRFIVYELQVQECGGLPRHVANAVTRPAKDPKPKIPSPALKSGGRLLREWNGVTHVVDVTDGGFVWKGQTWRSLSVIAREITGAQWSGPRFFGLNGKAQS